MGSTCILDAPTFHILYRFSTRYHLGYVTCFYLNVCIGSFLPSARNIIGRSFFRQKCVAIRAFDDIQ